MKLIIYLKHYVDPPKTIKKKELIKIINTIEKKFKKFKKQLVFKNKKKTLLEKKKLVDIAIFGIKRQEKLMVL